MKSYIRLLKAVNIRADKRFIYGKQDCCLFAAGCVAEMMNKPDFLNVAGIEDYRGPKEAQNIIDQFKGIAELVEHVCITNGMKKVVGSSTWGDLVIFMTDELTTGVVLDREVYTTREGKGLTKFPLDTIVASWRFE